MSWTLFPVRDFPKFRDHWQRLNTEGAASPLLDVAFVLPLLDAFGTGKEMLACYKRDKRMLAMAIIVRKNSGVWQTFQPSQAPLGMWVHQRGTDCTRLLAELTKTLPGFPLVVGITQQDPQLVMRPVDTKHIRTVDYIDTAKIPVEGSFESYWNDRGKNLRHNMKKQRSKLEKLGIATRLQLSTKPEEVAQAINDYGTLESAGWKAHTGTAIHPANTQGKFYQSMLQAFCLQGACRIYRYWYNDKIVSMILCIEGNGILVMLKMSYDESLKDGTSPAVLLRQELTRQIFDEGKVKTIEFYGKATPGNLQWTKEVRTLYHLNYYRFAALPLLHKLMRKQTATAGAES
jgi:hypothetical protein